jgi:hypothetical protein
LISLFGEIQGYIYNFTPPRRPERQQQSYRIDTDWEPTNFQKDLQLCQEALKCIRPTSPPEDLTVALAQGRRSLVKNIFPKFFMTPAIIYFAIRSIIAFLPPISILKLKQVRVGGKIEVVR